MEMTWIPPGIHLECGGTVKTSFDSKGLSPFDVARAPRQDQQDDPVWGPFWCGKDMAPLDVNDFTNAHWKKSLLQAKFL